MGQHLVCSYFNSLTCNSCHWIEQDYAGQLKQKEERLRLALALTTEFSLEKSIPSKLEGFRNRAKMVVTGSVSEPVIGLIGETNLDQGRELLHCPIHHPKLNEVIEAMPSFIRDFNLIPYQIENKKGELKSLILFYAPGTEQLYIRFILRSKECVSRIKKLLPTLQTRFPNLKCVSANIQPIPHAILEGHEEIYITDQKTIDYQLGELKMKLSPQAFVQTNVEVATQLYQTAANWIGEVKPESMIELFCGQGAFSFFAAKNAKKITGIEINADAVNTANSSAKEFGFLNLNFQCLDATSSLKINADLILVNPPRRGLADGIKIIQNQTPKNFIYSSCSIETLGEDLKKLASQYKIKRAQIFDMFPHTEHFETLVWLELI